MNTKKTEKEQTKVRQKSDKSQIALQDTTKNADHRAPKNVKNVKKRSSSIYIGFDFEAGQFGNISDKDIDRWREAYPACNVQIELKQMAEWLLSNPDKKKKQYRRFITNWLSRTQERGGTKGVQHGNVRTNFGKATQRGKYDQVTER